MSGENLHESQYKEKVPITAKILSSHPNYSELPEQFLHLHLHKVRPARY